MPDCEHERTYETRGTATNTTDTTCQALLYRSYSCALFFCPYPDRKCKVKEH